MAFAIDQLMSKSRDELIELARHRGSQIRGNASKDSLIVEHIRLNQAEADKAQSDMHKTAPVAASPAEPIWLTADEVRDALKKCNRINVDFGRDGRSCTITSIAVDANETCSLDLSIADIKKTAERLNAWLTEDEVREALAPYRGLIVEIRDEGRTCSLMSRGCEESVSMSVPLKVIKSIASRLGSYPQAQMIKKPGTNDLAETLLVI